MPAAYLDSNIVISLIEEGAARRAEVVTRLGTADQAASALVVSDLVRLECRVRPVATGNAALLAAYDSFFRSPEVRVIGLTAEVCDRATDIRGRHRFGTTDALHLAAAIEAGCAMFVTADRRLAAFGGIPIAMVPYEQDE